MKVLILNGNPDQRSGLDSYLDRLAQTLRGAGHSARILTLRELDIRSCTGCWSCWVRTPGECQFRDDSHRVCREYIAADFVLHASPLVMGTVAAVLKTANDKLLPLLHPYIEVVEGECHHRARYDAYPLVGLLLERGADHDDEDVAITRAIYQRNALNLKSRLCLTMLTDREPAEVADAIGAV
jgi:multimeric flavodoxin WrbA